MYTPQNTVIWMGPCWAIGKQLFSQFARFYVISTDLL